jgi:hypothetical protein
VGKGRDSQQWNDRTLRCGVSRAGQAVIGTTLRDTVLQ